MVLFIRFVYFQDVVDAAHAARPTWLLSCPFGWLAWVPIWHRLQTPLTDQQLDLSSIEHAYEEKMVEWGWPTISSMSTYFSLATSPPQSSLTRWVPDFSGPVLSPGVDRGLARNNSTEGKVVAAAVPPPAHKQYDVFVTKTTATGPMRTSRRSSRERSSRALGLAGRETFVLDD